MIVYPLDNWDTFCDAAEADTIIAGFVSQGNWASLTSPQKEAYLRQSSLLIYGRLFEPPTTAETPLKQATCYLSIYSIGRDMTVDDGKSNLKRIKIDGALEKEFFTRGVSSVAFPAVVNQLLEQYGLSAPGFFKLDRS